MTATAKQRHLFAPLVGNHDFVETAAAAPPQLARRRGQRIARPNRCQLFAPGSRPELFPKAAASAADVVNLDLEDSVAPADKPQARANIVRAVNELDWGHKTLSVRINGLDTSFWYRDVVDLIEQTGDRLDLIMIPKCGNAKDIYAVDALVSAVEQARGRTRAIGYRRGLEVVLPALGIVLCGGLLAHSGWVWILAAAAIGIGGAVFVPAAASSNGGQS